MCVCACAKGITCQRLLSVGCILRNESLFSQNDNSHFTSGTCERKRYKLADVLCRATEIRLLIKRIVHGSVTRMLKWEEFNPVKHPGVGLGTIHIVTIQQDHVALGLQCVGA